MSLSLKLKVEQAFVADYLPDVLTIGDLTVYDGHTPPDDDQMSLPALVVYAETATQHPEMPAEMGVRIVRLRMKFLVDSAAGDRDDLDTWKDELQEAMRDIDGIKTALNKPAGADTRTVQSIHFHHVDLTDEPSDQGETDWDEELDFDVIVEPLLA